MAKIYVVAAAARQIDGDIFLHMVEAAYTTEEAAQKHVRDRADFQVKTLPTEIGDVECYIKRTIYPLELS